MSGHKKTAKWTGRKKIDKTTKFISTGHSLYRNSQCTEAVNTMMQQCTIDNNLAGTFTNLLKTLHLVMQFLGLFLASYVKVKKNLCNFMTALK